MQVVALPSDWQMVDFGQVLTDVTRLSGKVLQRDYQGSGRFPIFDQGQTEVAGYSDDANDLFTGMLPVILFGDHTCRLKYVNTPFLLGADGTKILQVEHPSSYPKFVFYYLRSLNIQPEGYRRHFSLLKEYSVPIPYPNDPARSLAEQRRIVARLEALLGEVREMRKLQADIEANVGRLMEAVLAEVFDVKVMDGWPFVAALGDLVEINAPLVDPTFMVDPFVKTTSRRKQGDRHNIFRYRRSSSSGCWNVVNP